MKKYLNKIKLFLLVSLLGVAGYAQAALVDRTGLVEKVQMESYDRTGYENLMYVRQNATWTATTGCRVDWVYFDASKNPHFVATVLSARALSKELHIWVDSQFAISGGICKVVNMDF